jgi:formylglycine-generating enzyme required for sulfatase activity
MIAAFDTDELRALVQYDDTLSSLANEFAPAHPITTMVDRTISWCDRRALLPYLVQLVKEERPEKYRLFEPELLATGAEKPPEEKPPEHAPEILTITSPIYLDLVRVPAGEFQMGSVAERDEHARDNEFPPHQVHVPEFHIGKYPVTNLQYRAFVKATRTEPPRTWEKGSIPLGKENHPVTYLSWTDALAFCDWLSRESGQPFRLPTEAEWEKAARGTDGRIWPWGNEPPDESQCNFDSRVRDTTPIGRHSPQGDSPYGCADMAGNVTEWCTSLYRPYPYRARDGREDLEVDGRRVLRGGSFLDTQKYIRCAFRNWNHPYNRIRGFGFRVVVAPAPSGR